MAYTPSTGFGSLSDDKDAGSTVDSNAATFPAAPVTTSAYTAIDSAGSRSTDSTAIAADFVFATDAGDPANQSIFKRESEDLSQVGFNTQANSGIAQHLYNTQFARECTRSSNVEELPPLSFSARSRRTEDQA
ncbi:hypothetical protein GBA52_015389 [Prunus armeniaca]|nr:hypothetical protein GBA52_015389 [Prunus armeniaca]